ncbi:MAG: DNA-binding transcriptional regulator [Planctomycetia bacterium]|nr:DNA-binding transcriptional regulator [Planctomycetia bacterium]
MKRELQILLLMGTSHGFGRELMNGITQYLYEQGHSVEFELRGHLEPVPDWVKRWRGDGVIVRHNQQSSFTIWEKAGIPYLKLFCPNHPSDIDVDEDLLAELAVQHFLERGIPHFAYFSQCDLYWSNRRRDSFCRAVKRLKKEVSVYERHAEDTAPYRMWHPRERAEFVAWVRQLPKPVGMLAAFDYHARQVLELCRQEGISVPDDVAVLGVNNDSWFCRIQYPPLSSIIQNGRKIGQECARILCDKILGNPIPKLPLLFPPTGVYTRRSTDLIVTQDAEVRKALLQIRTQACQGLTIEQLVEENGYSRRALERKFRQELGRTLAEEILKVRLESAEELLRETDMAIGNIVFAVGLTSHSHFNRLFVKKHGFPPTEYRKRFQSFYD